MSSRSASVGGRDHTSHRLVALGFSERQAVLVLYSLAASSGLAAVAIVRSAVPEAGLIVGLLVIALALLSFHLARVRVYGDQDFAALRDKPFTPLLFELTYRRRVFEVLLDMVLVTVSYYAAYLIRFDRLFGVYYYRLFVDSLPIVIGCYLLSFFVVGIYRGVWRYVSAADILTHLKGVFLGTTLTVIALVFLFRFEGYSRGVIVINAMTLAILTIGSRVSFRLVAEVTSRRRIRSGQRTLIYGAGDGGALLLRELRNNQHYHFQPVGFVDDDERKHQRRILGLSVLGGSDNLEAIIAESGAEVVIISTSCLDDDRASRVAQVCFESGTGLLRMDLTLQQFSPRHPHASPGAGA